MKLAGALNIAFPASPYRFDYSLPQVQKLALFRSAFMRQVSFVFQDTFLFKQSILDNIRMGNPTASEAQVIEAAKAAQCHDFIEKLPDGYHTMIGASGIRLSGGERQRIAIARAIIKDAPIIVLDEATAFSDPENEVRHEVA